ncbi:MAG: TRAP transporter substrate-binding protein [Gammaproteobacteria bacterium]|nr:TRAP transporter substrate-binding protein [Gammaproteobacteria bacterium]
MKPKTISRRGVLKSAAGASMLLAMPAYVKGAKADHVLTFGHTFGKATENVMITGLQQWKEKAEEYAGGKLLIDIHEAGSLGGQNVLPQKVLQQSIQGCQLSTQNFTPFSAVYNLLDFPFLFSSNEKFEDMLGTEAFLSSAFISEPQSKGFTVLPGMWANAGHRVLGISKKKELIVKSPEDLDGVKIRVTGSKVEQNFFKLTPADPVSIAWGETYQALEQGAADALNVGLGPLTATRIFETLGSATLTRINFNCHITLLSAKWFDGLPGDVQDAILKGAAESFAFQRTGQSKANDEMIDMWKASGIHIEDPDPEVKRVWVESFGHQRPEWDELKEAYGKDVWSQLEGWAS